MVILLVGLEVILQLVDVGAQQSYLNLRGTGIAITLLKIISGGVTRRCSLPDGAAPVWCHRPPA